MHNLHTWVDVPEGSDFSIYNIPFGIAKIGDKGHNVVSIIGDQIINLDAVAALGLFNDLKIDNEVWHAEFLNNFIALGKDITSIVRTRLQDTLCDQESPLKDGTAFIPYKDVQMLMPVFVRDYTDFYSSIEHATNVGKMFRDPANALLPNWKHIPVGYHGRASSIVVSGIDIIRPSGQIKPTDGPPIFSPTQRLDFELEMAFVVGKPNPMGSPISVQEAEAHIFGLALFNDWSARDIQKWEYVPLGPFLGKNFASSVSPWIVPLEALDQVRLTGPVQDPPVLPYLQLEGKYNYDIQLEVGIKPHNAEETVVSVSNFKYMYWNMCQQLAHHTINGCNVNIGDMMASGTISGKDAKSYGSMLEIAWSGKKPITLSDGSQRLFINDMDTVIMRGYASIHGHKVGFGDVQSRVLPAR